MTIHCSICGRKMQSFKPPADAQKTVLELMSIHLKQHPAEYEQSKVMLQLMATYLLFQYIEIPPEEIELKASVEQNEEAVAAILGFEPETETAS